jgi:hypothetical protein
MKYILQIVSLFLLFIRTACAMYIGFFTAMINQNFISFLGYHLSVLVSGLIKLIHS